MMIACGFAEDGKRRKKAWSIERRAKRQLKRTSERMSRKLLDAVGRIAHLDDLTRMRFRIALRSLWGDDFPPPPLLPAA
jgi:hypothetical protein